MSPSLLKWACLKSSHPGELFTNATSADISESGGCVFMNALRRRSSMGTFEIEFNYPPLVMCPILPPLPTIFWSRSGMKGPPCTSLIGKNEGTATKRSFVLLICLCPLRCWSIFCLNIFFFKGKKKMNPSPLLLLPRYANPTPLDPGARSLLAVCFLKDIVISCSLSRV